MTPVAALQDPGVDLDGAPRDAQRVASSAAFASGHGQRFDILDMRACHSLRQRAWCRRGNRRPWPTQKHTRRRVAYTTSSRRSVTSRGIVTIAICSVGSAR